MRVPFLALSVALLLFAAGDAWWARVTPSGPAAIEGSQAACGTGWRRPHPGAQTLLVRNSGNVSSGVMLTDARTGAVYAELEGIGPGTTRQMHVTIGGGSYYFRCVTDSAADPAHGPVIRVSGGAPAGPAVLPVTDNDLYAPLKAYEAYVKTGLDALVTKVDDLREVAGDRDAARRAWLPAHLAYERLGAAYGTFDEFDGKINGRPAGLPGGVHDPDFTGFHRVEYELWHGGSAVSAADRLDRDVRALRAAFPDQRMDPADLPLRAHEILENTLQFQLTGDADQGSGTTFRTAEANLAGTREVLSVLRPLLKPRYPALPQVDAWLDRAEAAYRSDDRVKSDGVTGELLERLAPIATICAPRRTS